jgi:hypothetical protein
VGDIVKGDLPKEKPLKSRKKTFGDWFGDTALESLRFFFENGFEYQDESNATDTHH